MATEKVNAFDVLKHMSAENKDIHLAPPTNILSCRKVKHGYIVEIGVGPEIGSRIAAGESFHGGLILANREQFLETDKLLEDKQQQI